MAPSHWMRFSHRGEIGFGLVDGEVVQVHAGDMFDAPVATGVLLARADLVPLAPCEPSKIIALWNNFHALAEKLGQPVPAEPLFLLKAVSSIAAPEAAIPRPAGCEGRVAFEGELGIVIGRRLSRASLDEADAAIFGFTCVNDLTAIDVLARDPSFPQWARAKSYDGFGPFGTTIATGLDLAGARVTTTVDGTVRQSYPIADMVFPPAELVRRLSHDMTLLPGDLICCGTSIGVGTLKGPSNLVEVAIDGIGTLWNRFEQ